MATFGAQLRHHREALGWTRKELAHRISCATVTIQKLERDERRPSVQMATQITKQLDLLEDESKRLLALARPSTNPVLIPAQQAQASGILIGRNDELRQIRNIFIDEGVRLLTLTGPGGVGKTRLATDTLDTLSNDYPSGHLMMELTSLAHSDLIIDFVARRLGLQPQGGAEVMALLTAFLQGKQMLLCLDNFEHLLEGASYLEQLLAACPALTLLVTSRQALGLAQEQVVTVQPLALDESGTQSGNAPDRRSNGGRKCFLPWKKQA